MRAHAQLTLDHLHGAAAKATAAGSKSFYFATRFFPPEMARSAHAVYWFCRFTDDLVDECDSVAQGRRDLEHWADEVDRAFATGTSEHPVLRVFLAAAQRHSIPREYAFELIEGMRMDLNGTRYRNFEELRVFCYRVASIVGLMMCQVIGFAEPTQQATAQERAVELGIAMQLTNILRDVGEDWERGRVYLPFEEMADFGYGEAALARRERSEDFRALMRFQIRRAREYYRVSQPGIPMLNPEGRFAVQVASDVYREILGRIEAADYDVFERRAVVPPVRKYWITARSMAVPAVRQVSRQSLLRLAFWRS